MVAATWGKAMGKVQARSATLAAGVLSVGRRARAWNTYVRCLSGSLSVAHIPPHEARGSGHGSGTHLDLPLGVLGSS
eukprot:15195136-Alexandrium_andersonii.AAC.1